MQYINSEGLLIDTVKNESRICGITNSLSGDAVALLGRSNTIGASSLTFQGNNNTVSSNSILFGGEYNILSDSFLLKGSNNSLSDNSILFQGTNNTLSASLVVNGENNYLTQNSVSVNSKNSNLSASSISFFGDNNISQNNSLSFYTENTQLSSGLSISGKNNTIKNSINVEGSNNTLNSDSLNVLGDSNTASVSSISILGQNNTVTTRGVAVLSDWSQVKNNGVAVNIYNTSVDGKSLAILENESIVQTNSFGYGGNNNILRLSSLAINTSNSRLTDNSFAAFTTNSVVSTGSISIGKSDNVNLRGNSLGVYNTNTTVSSNSISINNINSTLLGNSLGLISNNVKVSSSSIEILGTNNIVAVSSIDILGFNNFSSGGSTVINSRSSSATVSSLIVQGNTIAAANNSVSLGGNNITIPQSRSIAVGGDNVNINATNTLIIGGKNVTGSNDILDTTAGQNIISVGGTGNKIGSNSTSIGGINNEVSNNSLFIGGTGNKVGNFSNVTMINVKDVIASESDTAYLPRSFFTGNLTVKGNVSASGNITSIDTLVTTEWVARLVNYLQTSAVLYCDQRNFLGNYNVAEFYSMGSPRLFVTNQGVGVNTNFVPSPYVFTINGPASGVNLLLNDRLTFGNGDTNLYRSTADTLRTDDNLIVQQNLTTFGNLSASGNINTLGNLSVSGNVFLGSDASDTLTFNGGPVNYPNATSVADAIVIGGDTNIYRSATDTLKTDDNLNVGTLITGTTNAVIIHSENTLQQRNINPRSWDTVATYLSGTPTHNYVVKAKGSNELVNSLVFDNGTNVGINTSTPNYNLTINGGLSSNGASYFGQGNTSVTSLGYKINVIGDGGHLAVVGTDPTTRTFGVSGTIDTPLAMGDGGLITSWRGFVWNGSSYNGLGYGGVADIQYISDGNQTSSNSGAFMRFLTTSVGTVNSIAERMRLTSTGNLGIGTTIPQLKLDVNGSIRSLGNADLPTRVFNSAIYSGGFSSPNIGRLFIGDNTGWRYLISNRTGNSTTDLVTFTDQGRVGIGLNLVPTQRLHVVDPANSDANGTALFASTGGNANIRIDAASTGSFAYQTFSQGGTGRFELGISSVSSDFYINPNVQSGSTGSALYIQKSSGNISINSAPLTHKLNVNGEVFVQNGWLRTAGNLGWYSETHGGGWHMTDTSWIRTYNEKNVWTGSGLLGAQGGLTIGWGGVAPTTGGAIIKGNVGIGETTNPSARLHIRETAAGTNSRVHISSTQDVQMIYSTDREGVIGYSWGQDVSDGHKFKIANWFNDLRTNTRLTIDTNGRVGINTSTPWASSALDVRGGVIRIGWQNTAYGFLQLGASDTTTKNWHIGVETDDCLRIYSGTWGSGTERLRFDSSGRAIFATPNGTAVTPAISLNPSFGGASMGLYADGGHLRFSVGGSERLRLQNDGGVICAGYSTFYGKINAVGSEGIIGINGGGSGGMFEQQSSVSGTGNAAYMTFHRPGLYAVKFGLDTDNKLKIGGWSMGNVSYDIWHDNNAYTKADAKYVIRSGDTLTGRLGQSDSGFHAGTKNVINTRTDSGFFQTFAPTIANGWPTTTIGWYHLLANSHTNDSNYYSMQFAGAFNDSNEIYYRATGNDGNSKWNKVWHEGNSGQFIRRWAKFRNWNGCSGEGSYYRTNVFIDQIGNLYAAGYSAGYWFGKCVDGQNTYLGGGFTNITPNLNNGEKVVEVYLGARSMYVLTNTGQIWATGYNGYSQLGSGSTTDTLEWQYVTDGVISFATNVGRTGVGCCLAIKTDGVYAWGYNGVGNLGDGTTINITRPKRVLVGSFTKVVTTTAEETTSGWGSSMALRSDGVLFMAGSNQSGCFGIGRTYAQNNYYTSWQQVATNVKNCWVANDSSVRATSFYLSNANLLYAAGNNYHGWIGNGVFDGDSNTAKSWVLAGGGLTYTDMSMCGWSGRSVIALRPDGTVRTWGYNSQGECGDGTVARRNTPFNPGLTDIIKVKLLGYDYATTGALKSDGNLWLCGYNGYGQLGRGGTVRSSTFAPARKNGNIKFVDFDLWGESSGTGVSAADEQGQVWSWGYNAQYSCAQTINDANYNNRVEMPMPCSIHGF
jgi:alpha-tubulin suppressor-like RCC1 family protein